MEQQEVSFQEFIRNLSLWLCVALLLTGMTELTGLIQVVPEPYRFPFMGPCMLLASLVLGIAPYRSIKQDIAKHKAEKAATAETK